MSSRHLVAGWVEVCVGVIVSSLATVVLLGQGRAGTPAEQAMREAIQHCGKAAVVWQASSTNEPGVIWFSAKCEVQK